MIENDLLQHRVIDSCCSGGGPQPRWGCGILLSRLPQGSRGRQPWAGGRNRVAVAATLGLRNPLSRRFRVAADGNPGLEDATALRAPPTAMVECQKRNLGFETPQFGLLQWNQQQTWLMHRKLST
jgi:hypothetical protein